MDPILRRFAAKAAASTVFIMTAPWPVVWPALQIIGRYPPLHLMRAVAVFSALVWILFLGMVSLFADCDCRVEQRGKRKLDDLTGKQLFFFYLREEFVAIAPAMYMVLTIPYAIISNWIRICRSPA